MSIASEIIVSPPFTLSIEGVSPHKLKPYAKFRTVYLDGDVMKMGQNRSFWTAKLLYFHPCISLIYEFVRGWPQLT